MPEYLSVTQFAQMHGLHDTNVRKFIRQGRIPEAFKVGNAWVIPSNVKKPDDQRVKTGQYVNWRKKKNPTDD